MFASNLFRDETEVRQFLSDVEMDLRAGRASDAAERLDFALGVVAEFGHPIAALCRAYPATRIQLHGWDSLAARLDSLDNPDMPITAIGIDLSAHGERTPDNDDAQAPYLQTNFYSDNAFAFSAADRSALCAAYDISASEWQGKFEDIDGTIQISGIGKLCFAIDALEQQHRTGGSDDPVGSDAMIIATAYRAVIVHQAVAATIAAKGLPRPLTVIVGSNESYPFFDAPVTSYGDYQQKSDAIEASLSPEVVSSQVAFESGENNPPLPPTVSDHFANFGHISGSEIRRRFADPAVPVAETGKTGLMSRLFGR